MFLLTDPMKCPSCDALFGTATVTCVKCQAYNNACRLLLTPAFAEGKVDIPREQQLGFEHAAHFMRVSDFTLEQMFVYMKKIEAIAAGFSLAYNEQLVKKRIADPKKLARDAEEFTEAVKTQRIEQLPKKERKMLDDRQKAINAIFDIYVTLMPEKEALEKATAEVEKRMSKEGRLIKV